MVMKNKIKEFSEYIKSIGGRLREKAFHDYDFAVETIYGKMNCSIHARDFTKSGKPRSKHGNLVSIYASFQDFDLALPYLRDVKGETRPTNSKTNYHSSGGYSAEENWDSNFERFKQDLEKILVKTAEIQ